ncbi:hypothetical protein Hanom_Chr07g00632501 [Helianthus anomalus]
MSSKIGEFSATQTSSDILSCKWGTISFNNLLQEYDNKTEWNPVFPSGKDTAFSLEQGKITMSSDFFKFCNFWLPITKFCKSVLNEYQIYISQVHHLGFLKPRHFEKSPFFSFDQLDIGVSCIRSVTLSSRDKDWKIKFFYIEADVIPGEMHWREMGSNEKFKDEGPPADAYIENALFKKLSKHPSECQVIPERTFVLVGMSLLWRDSRLYPSFQRFDNGKYQFVVNKSASDFCSDMLIMWGQRIPYKDNQEKSATLEVTASPVAAGVPTAPEGVGVTSAPVVVSPRPAPKWCRTIPSLSTFQATKTAQLLHTVTLAGAQVEGGSSIPLTSGEISTSAIGGQSMPLVELISQASMHPGSSSMLPPCSLHPL